MSYPSTYDNLPQVISGELVNTDIVNGQSSAINALETALGLNPNGTYGTVAAAVTDVGNKVSKTGDSMSGSLGLAGNLVTSVGTPLLSTDLAPKSYADQVLIGLYPWVVDINVFPTAISQTNWDSIVRDTNGLYWGYKLSGGNQNDEINWDVVLAAGTWTFELLHVKAANFGIYSVQLDGVEKGTIDGYNSSTQYNQRTAVSSIAVATTAKIRVKLKMTSKNVGSSGYYGCIVAAQLRRTA